MSKKQNAFYAQSGGVTAVINASAAAVIKAVRENSDVIGTLYAGQNGIIGALTEDLIDTALLSEKDIEALYSTPSGAFGSCRYKLKSLEENRREYERLIEVFKAHNIGYFFYNGGGDSADTCLKVSQISEAMGFPIKAIHIPKTVDNDLPITDNSPGFGSVAKYVAISTLEASLDVASMAKTSTKVFILEVMGRHAGWIAAAAGLATVNVALPLIILFPEIVFDRRKFLRKVEEMYHRYGYVTIVVSEGVHDGEKYLADHGLTDAFGHAQLGGVAPMIASIIKEEMGLKYHWSVADYMQRSARHIASKADVEQAFAVGKEAVNLALAGENSAMPTIVRIGNNPYRWEIGYTTLDLVANKEKKVPMEYISKDGFGITDACKAYLKPLIEGEEYPPYRDGVPDYISLNYKTIQKKLEHFEV